MPQSNNTKIYTQGGRVGGIVSGDVLKKVYKKKYILQNPVPSLCVDVDILEQAKRAGCCWIEYLDDETGTTYRTNIDHMARVGISFDFGYGKQVRMAITAFTVVRKPRPQASQMAFEGVR